MGPEQISEGVALITATLPKGSIGAYQLQAAIAAVHDEAARAEDTDWPQILALYDLLKRMSDNPMVMLNHAIAAAMVHGPSAGLELLNALDADGRLTGHHRLDAVRAHLLEMAGDHQAAIAHYRDAAGRTTSLPERNYLLTRQKEFGEVTPAPVKWSAWALRDKGTRGREVERKIEAGLASARRGKVLDGDVVMRELRGLSEVTWWALLRQEAPANLIPLKCSSEHRREVDRIAGFDVAVSRNRFHELWFGDFAVHVRLTVANLSRSLKLLNHLLYKSTPQPTQNLRRPFQPLQRQPQHARRRKLRAAGLPHQPHKLLRIHLRLPMELDVGNPCRRSTVSIPSFSASVLSAL